MSGRPNLQTILLRNDSYLVAAAVPFCDQITNTVYSDIEFRTPAEFANISVTISASELQPPLSV